MLFVPMQGDCLSDPHQSSLLDLAAETRCLIYYHLFRQPCGNILGLSRQPEHDYSKGPPDDWIADSREAGLVYDIDTERPSPTNSRALRTCKRIRHEATPVFYGTNKIILYAEDNNDVRDTVKWNEGRR